MERQRSLRGFVEKQKSFRVVIERQLSFMNGERKMKKNESPGKRGDSPLHIAARTGNLGKVMESIRSCNGAEELKELLSKQNLEGETPLYTAADNGHSLVVEEMLKHMNLEIASIAARNGFDPFHVAAKQGHLETLKRLLETFPNLAMTTDLLCTTALHTAATQGHIDVVNLLLKTDSHLAKIAKNNGKTALHSAARMGHVEVVKSLIGSHRVEGERADNLSAPRDAIPAEVMAEAREELREVLIQYTSCADPSESAARKERLRRAEKQGEVDESAEQFARQLMRDQEAPQMPSNQIQVAARVPASQRLGGAQYQEAVTRLSSS
ncbi:unnamed protein product, partial [Brassica oleracea]